MIKVGTLIISFYNSYLNYTVTMIYIEMQSQNSADNIEIKLKSEKTYFLEQW